LATARRILIKGSSGAGKSTLGAVRAGRRWLRNEELWKGNRETLKGAQSLFAWAVRAHLRHRPRWPAQLAERPLVRLRSAREVEQWLERFCADSGAPSAPRR
jgi:hypothetical protein